MLLAYRTTTWFEFQSYTPKSFSFLNYHRLIWSLFLIFKNKCHENMLDLSQYLLLSDFQFSTSQRNRLLEIRVTKIHEPPWTPRWISVPSRSVDYFCWTLPNRTKEQPIASKLKGNPTDYGKFLSLGRNTGITIISIIQSIKSSYVLHQTHYHKIR